jgi:hypothetical protein
MISYVELIILVHFIFQFDIFPKSDPIQNVETKPFSLSNLLSIIGIEKRSSVVICNVTLLVCLFLHRYMLRRIGLWNDDNGAEEEGRRQSLEPEESDGEVSFCVDFGR